MSATATAASLRERFIAKVAPHPTGCWEWTGHIDRDGYGKFSRELAHRLSYRLFNGSIPQGHEIHHTCERRSCVNPSHLRALTRNEHARFSPKARQTHCKWGHPFDAVNTYVTSRGNRICRACNRAHSRAYRIARKAMA